LRRPRESRRRLRPRHLARRLDRRHRRAALAGALRLRQPPLLAGPRRRRDRARRAVLDRRKRRLRAQGRRGGERRRPPLLVRGVAASLMRRAIACAVLLLLASSAAADTIPLAQYIRALERLQTLLAANQLQLAAGEARALSAHDVASPQGRFHADATLLDAIASASRVDVQLRSRLAVTVDELRRLDSGTGPAADPKILQRVAAEQEVPELVEGGDLTVTPRSTPLVDRVAHSLERIWDWIIDKLSRFLDSLTERPGATGGMRWIVGALVVVIVLLILFLALEVRRRTRRASKSAIEIS